MGHTPVNTVNRQQWGIDRGINRQIKIDHGINRKIDEPRAVMGVSRKWLSRLSISLGEWTGGTTTWA